MLFLLKVSKMSIKLPQTPGWRGREGTALYHRWRNFLDVLQKTKQDETLTHFFDETEVHTVVNTTYFRH